VAAHPSSAGQRRGWVSPGPGGPRGLHAQVLSDIGAQIVSGEVEPGSVLPREQDLRERYGVSRTLLREVIRVLHAKGLVEPKQGLGTQVLPRSRWKLLDQDVLDWMSVNGPDGEFLKDLEEIRAIIEPSAARMAADRANGEDLTAMADALDRMVESGDDYERFSHADADFHGAILDASHNALLRETASAIVHAMGVRNLAVTSLGSPLVATIEEHRQIFEAIKEGDSSHAFEAMNALLHRSEMEQVRAESDQAKRKSTLRPLKSH
jgi:GntR family transcriptional regulator, galactonate operon transcriptional repressor